MKRVEWWDKWLEAFKRGDAAQMLIAEMGMARELKGRKHENV